MGAEWLKDLERERVISCFASDSSDGQKQHNEEPAPLPEDGDKAIKEATAKVLDKAE